MAAATHSSILTAAGTAITALALASAGTALPVVKRFGFTPDWARAASLPCISYGPTGILAPIKEDSLKRDTGYPLTIRHLSASDKETPEQGTLYLTHIHTIREALQEDGLTVAGVHVFQCELQPGPLIEVEAAALNILSLALTFNVKVRETR